MNYRSIAGLNKDIVGWLPRLPRDVDLVVGIPRSGLLAANILALHLNLPLTDPVGLLEGKVFDAGHRYRLSRGDTAQPSPRFERQLNILVIDDSVCTGTQLERVRQQIAAAEVAHNIRYAAVYVVPGAENKVDFYCGVLPMPRCFEWNIMHHAIVMSNSCIDIDGVLCRDPTDDENDDGACYERFLGTAEALLVPTVSVGWLVTCRLEKYRELTEHWLAQHGVKYRSLIMMDLPDKESRVRSKSHVAFKTGVYRKTGAELFIESSLGQAVEIARLAGKNVLCIETREMVTPTGWVKGYQAMKGIRSIVRRKVTAGLRRIAGLVGGRYA